MDRKLLSSALRVLANETNRQRSNAQDLQEVERHTLPVERGMALEEICCRMIRRELDKSTARTNVA